MIAGDNEWGIPDWRDPDSYGDWRSWSRERWRWEFCRRKDELRSHFDEQAKRLAKAPSGEADFRAFVRTLRIVNPSNRILRKFGYFILPNPRLSQNPRKSWLKSPEPLPVRAYEPKPIRQALIDVEFLLTEEVSVALGHIFELTPVSIENGQIAIIFDISKPLTSQIESAKASLGNFYSKNGVQPYPRDRLTKETLKSRRQTADLRLSLLQTLDARAAGMTLKDIAGLHPLSEPTKETGRDKLKQAQEMWLKLSLTDD